MPAKPLPQPLTDEPTQDRITRSQTPVTWSIWDAERDTRTVTKKAAGRTDKTISQYINEDVRRFA